LWVKDELAAHTTVFFNEMNITNDHSPVHCFAHNIDGEEGDLHDKEGFNLNAGDVLGLNGCLCSNSILTVIVEVDIDTGEGDEVAHGDHFRSPFSGHDSCHLGDSEDIALFYLAIFNSLQGGCLHMDLSLSRSGAEVNLCIGYIDHAGSVLVIEMC